MSMEEAKEAIRGMVEGRTHGKAIFTRWKHGDSCVAELRVANKESRMRLVAGRWCGDNWFDNGIFRQGCNASMNRSRRATLVDDILLAFRRHNTFSSGTLLAIGIADSPARK